MSRGLTKEQKEQFDLERDGPQGFTRKARRQIKQEEYQKKKQERRNKDSKRIRDNIISGKNDKSGAHSKDYKEERRGAKRSRLSNLLSKMKNFLRF